MIIMMMMIPFCSKYPILAFLAITISPLLILTSSSPVPVIALNKVLFPAPLRPTKAHLSFGSMDHVTSFIISLLPIDKRKSFISIAAPLEPLNVTPEDFIGISEATGVDIIES
jgi:hypothetical protein